MKATLALLAILASSAENYPYSEISLDPAPRFQSSAERCPKDRIYQITGIPQSVSSLEDGLTLRLNQIYIEREQCLYQRCIGERLTDGTNISAYTDGLTKKGMKDVSKAFPEISELIRTEPEKRITIFGCAYSSETLYLLGLQTSTHAYIFYNPRNQLLVTRQANH